MLDVQGGGIGAHCRPVRFCKASIHIAAAGASSSQTPAACGAAAPSNSRPRPVGKGQRVGQRRRGWEVGVRVGNAAKLEQARRSHQFDAHLLAGRYVCACGGTAVQSATPSRAQPSPRQRRTRYRVKFQHPWPGRDPRYANARGGPTSASNAEQSQPPWRVPEACASGTARARPVARL